MTITDFGNEIEITQVKGFYPKEIGWKVKYPLSSDIQRFSCTKMGLNHGVPMITNWKEKIVSMIATTYYHKDPTTVSCYDDEGLLRLLLDYSLTPSEFKELLEIPADQIVEESNNTKISFPGYGTEGYI